MKMSSYLQLAILFFVSLGLGSCLSVGDPVHETSLAIRNNWDEFIYHWESQNAEACAGMYHENGLNIPNGFVVNKGKDAIEKFYQMLFANNGASKYKHTILSISTAGDQAIELGEFKVDWAGNDSISWTYHARSLTHWEKDSDGMWKIKTFMFNQPPAPSK